MSSPAHNRNLNGYGTHKSLDTNGGTNTGVITQTGRIPMHNTIKKMQARGGAGFTLIELLVVIAILAILSGVVVFAVGKSTDNAGLAACKTERASIITGWNAAAASNKISGNNETWANYLKSSDFQYFDSPAAGTTPAAVNRSATKNTGVSDAAGDCPDIPSAEFQS